MGNQIASKSNPTQKYIKKNGIRSIRHPKNNKSMSKRHAHKSCNIYFKINIKKIIENTKKLHKSEKLRNELTKLKKE